MPQRWLGTTLLQAERKFRTIKGHLSIPEVRKKIVEIQEITAMIVA